MGIHKLRADYLVSDSTGKVIKVDDIITSGGTTTITSNQISDATAVGKSLLTATDAATARTAIGAGTPYTLPAATSTVIGGVKQMATIAPLTAAPTQQDFNGLLTALQSAGLMA